MHSFQQNFLALCASGVYDNTMFHRNIPKFMVSHFISLTKAIEMISLKKEEVIFNSCYRSKEAIRQERVKEGTASGANTLTMSSLMN